jgi:hypothetical protein
MTQFTTIRAIADTKSDGDNLTALIAAAASGQIVLTPLQAASDQRNLPLLRTIMATAERIGLRVEGDKKIDTLELNRALDAGVRANLIKQGTRWDFKAQLASLHLI